MGGFSVRWSREDVRGGGRSREDSGNARPFALRFIVGIVLFCASLEPLARITVVTVMQIVRVVAGTTLAIPFIHSISLLMFSQAVGGVGRGLVFIEVSG